MSETDPRNILEKFFRSMFYVLEKPVIFVREKIVTPNQKVYPWYHQKLRRVPTIDECDMDDPICYFEADAQFKRDKKVDNEILNILRKRFEDCTIYEAPDNVERCTHLWDQYNEATTNWFIKYGDLGAYYNVRSAFMKQKHRMIWERRHGPVGSGRRTEETAEDLEVH